MYVQNDTGPIFYRDARDKAQQRSNKRRQKLQKSTMNCWLLGMVKSQLQIKKIMCTVRSAVVIIEKKIFLFYLRAVLSYSTLFH